jgi:putative tricarboxylic transport membrane protein
VRLRTPIALLGAALLVLVGPPLLTSGSGAETGTQIPGLRFMVPNTPGGGYDITARTAAKNAEDAGLTPNIEVFNLPGAGGTVGLTRLVGEHGNGKLAMSMGLGVVGAVHTNKSPKTLADTTPIARLTEEQDIVVVAKDSPYKDIGQLVEAWKKNPGKLPVGGGSSPGGPDHLAPMLMAQAAGIAPKSVNYIPFDGGGELLASILGNKVAFGVSGVGEYLDQIRSGELDRSASLVWTRPPCARPGSTPSSPTGAASWPRRASPTASATSSSAWSRSCTNRSSGRNP